MNSPLFHIVEDAFAILVRNGVYKQAQIYHRDGRLYAAYSGGFIRLTTYGTSVPNIRLDGLNIDVAPKTLANGQYALKG
jgi:drug/metabolite transporter superfamily protein YnfA